MLMKNRLKSFKMIINMILQVSATGNGTDSDDDVMYSVEETGNVTSSQIASIPQRSSTNTNQQGNEAVPRLFSQQEMSREQARAFNEFIRSEQNASSANTGSVVNQRNMNHIGQTIGNQQEISREQARAFNEFIRSEQNSSSANTGSVVNQRNMNPIQQAPHRIIMPTASSSSTIPQLLTYSNTSTKRGASSGCSTTPKRGASSGSNQFGQAMRLPSVTRLPAVVTSSSVVHNPTVLSLSNEIMRQLNISLDIARIKLRMPNVPSEEELAALEKRDRINRTAIPTLYDVIGRNVQGYETRECVDATYFYINRLVENYVNTNRTEGIADAFEMIKKAFVSESNLQSSDGNLMKYLSIGFYLSTIPRSWNQNDFVAFNEFVARYSLADNCKLFDVVAPIMKERSGFDRNAVMQPDSREMLALKYFNKPLNQYSRKTWTNQLKATLYNSFVILGSDAFIDRLFAVNSAFPVYSPIRDELKLHLNVLKSPYFVLPFFKSLDYITSLSAENFARYLPKFREVILDIDNAIFNIFDKPQLREKALDQNYRLSVVDFINLPKGFAGLLKTTTVIKILNDIDTLTNDWVAENMDPSTGIMTQKSYSITVFLNLLKCIVVAFNDVITVSMRNGRNQNMNPDQARRGIFVHLIMLSFDTEKVKQFLSIREDAAQP